MGSNVGWKVWVPGNELRAKILEQFHDQVPAGHPGADRTRLGVRSLFRWPKMDQSNECFVRSCARCARRKASHLKSGGVLQPLSIPNFPWEKISPDFIVALPVTEEGHESIVTIVRRLTKMAQAADSAGSLDGRSGKNHRSRRPEIRRRAESNC